MKTLILSLVALFCMSCAFGADGSDGSIPIAERTSVFLAKLTSSMSASSSKVGDPVTAEAIDPVPLRGALLEGTVDRADHSILVFSFHTVSLNGKTYPVRSRVVAIVSSKGIEGQDDLGQRIRMEGGTMIAYGTTTALDEGAEIQLTVWQKK